MPKALASSGFAAIRQHRRRPAGAATRPRAPRRKGDPPYSIRRVLRRGHEHLTDVAWDRLLTGLDAGDVDGQVAAAWIAAQHLRLLYRAKTRDQAQRRLHRWLEDCADSELPELHRLARTIDAWRPELPAYFDTGGISNGPTEAMNLLIKKVKRTGHGLPQLRRPPAPAAAVLRRRLAHSTTNADQRTDTTVDCVEPTNRLICGLRSRFDKARVACWWQEAQRQPGAEAFG
ncbi:MAG TPA: transposase [Pedococcus sp.]|nr:transposase [Pedococcus sp.]